MARREVLDEQIAAVAQAYPDAAIPLAQLVRPPPC
jgi:hypothetical protein